MMFYVLQQNAPLLEFKAYPAWRETVSGAVRAGMAPKFENSSIVPLRVSYPG